MRQIGEMAHRSPRDLAADLLAPTVLTGDLTADDAAALSQHPNAVLPGMGLRRRRASVLVDMALPRWLAGEPDDLTELEPLYVHQQSADRGGPDVGTDAGISMLPGHDAGSRL